MDFSISSFQILLGILVMGCLDTIDLKPTPGREEAIIVDGRLVFGDTTRIDVSVMSLFNFQANQTTPFPVEYVRCYNSLGQHTALKATELGLYQVRIPASQVDFAMEPGLSYHIQVKSVDGTTYTSTPDVLTEVLAGELLVETKTKVLADQIGGYEDVPFICFAIKMPLVSGINSENHRFKFSFERAFRFTDNTDKTCYAFQEFDIPNLVVFETRMLNKNITDVVIPLIEIKIDFYFSEGYYLNLFQESLSEESFTYWQDVQSLTIRTGNQFEPIAGRAATNVMSSNPDDQVFGYFYCSSEALSRIYISPEFAGDPLRLCPGTPYECIDCLFFPRSQLNKPAFWIE